MSRRVIARVSVVTLVCVLLSVAAAATAAQRDPVWVDTFRNEFINWASPHDGTFTFPEPALYDRIICHVTIACPEAPADCDPWDRFGNLRLLGPNDEYYEIVRFITPYDITFGGGPGTCAWEIDVTDYQFLLHGEVTLRLYIDSWIGGDDGWLLTIRFEMRPGVPEREPFAVEKLWSTGGLIYGDPDNPETDHLVPTPITMPTQATWATFRTFATGHGFLNTHNAAEFSYKWQQILVDDNVVQHYLWRPDCEYNRCSPQLGTWEYDRAGWCPGDKADPWDVDVSDWVSPGVEAIYGFEVQPYTNICRPNNPDCVNSPTCECPGHAYYRLESQVIFYRVPNPTAVGDGRLVPGTLHLVGNYPNPFNPRTLIRYHIAQPGTVLVSIYNAEGALVRTQQVDHAAAGQYSWSWSGRGQDGQMMPAGVYLYELRHGDQRVSAKMLLLK